MKKAIFGVMALALIGGVIFGFFIYQKQNTSQTQPTTTTNTPPTDEVDWKFQKNITASLTATSASGEVTLGNIATDKIVLKIDGNAFDNETSISVSNPDKTPRYIGTQIETLGAPIEINPGKPARLNEKATITFSFDKSLLSGESEASLLRVAYFNGEKWDYIKPTSVDYANGLITFETYHFSLLGATKIKDETVLTENWIHSKTLDKQLRDNINKVTDHIANQIIDRGLEKMGIADKTLKSKILGELLKENDYKDVYDAYQKGETTDAAQKIAILAGKKMAEIIPASTLQEHLKDLTGDSDDFGSRAKDVAAVAQAAGNIAEGRYKDAAKIIGEQIIDKTSIGLAGKVAVEVVKGQIEDWKSSEVEAAYEAYKHGANGVFYGYNVDKGDFDNVWDQMRGIRRQLEIEAIRKQNEGRADAGLPALTEAQAELVRAGVKESFRKQFSVRSEKEEEFKKQEDELRILVEAFKRNNLLDTTAGPVGLDKGLDYENKLDVLYHFAQKIQADTKRFQLSDKNGLVMTDKISVDDIAQGARYWFSGPDGKKQYQQFLKDRFNIDPFPKLKDLAGNWDQGKMVINDIIIPEELKNQPKGSGDEGCDFNMDLSQIKGKEVPVKIGITPQSETGGTLDFVSDKETKSIPFTYEDGVIKATFSEKGAMATLEFPVTQTDQGYAINGSLNVSYKSGDSEAKILTTVTTSKGAKTDASPNRETSTPSTAASSTKNSQQ